MKKFLENLIAKRKQELENLNTAMIEAESKEERAAIGETLKKLAAEIKEAEDQLAGIDDPAGDEGGEGGAEGASGEEGRKKFSFVASMQTRSGMKADEGTSSLEYRKAFQKYMATGKMEYRADESGKTTDENIATVIPENLVNKILEKYEQLGTIYNLVTKTAFAVGQAIPVDGLKPTATWVGRNASTPASSTSGEGASSDSQKKSLGARIVFAHYKLRCEIRYSEEVSTMTLPAFEDLFVRQVGEAMLRAQEWATVEGDGYGMPTGILNEEAAEGQALTVPGGVMTYEKLCECEAAVPAEYEAGAKWCMTKKTFMAFVGMVDSVGQPVARVNYGIGGKPERTLLGREVVIYQPQANSKVKDLSKTAAVGSVVAFIFDFADYVLNTNYDLGISHAKDWDNEDHKTKAVLACDGKVIDKGSLVTLAVGAAE